MNQDQEAAREVRSLIAKFDEAKEETKKSRQVAAEVSVEDRELIRSDLTSLADTLRRKYGMSIPEIRRFLHEMLDVSV